MSKMTKRDWRNKNHVPKSSRQRATHSGWKSVRAAEVEEVEVLDVEEQLAEMETKVSFEDLEKVAQALEGGEEVTKTEAEEVLTELLEEEATQALEEAEDALIESELLDQR